MKNRREITKTKWVTGMPAKSDIGGVFFIKLPKHKRPLVMKVVDVAEDGGSITVQPAGESYYATYKKDEIEKHSPVPPKTREAIKCT